MVECEPLGNGGVATAYHEFYGLLDAERSLSSGGGLAAGGGSAAAAPHGAWNIGRSDSEARRQARAVHVLGKDRTVGRCRLTLSNAR